MGLLVGFPTGRSYYVLWKRHLTSTIQALPLFLRLLLTPSYLLASNPTPRLCTETGLPACSTIQSTTKEIPCGERTLVRTALPALCPGPCLSYNPPKTQNASLSYLHVSQNLQVQLKGGLAESRFRISLGWNNISN